MKKGPKAKPIAYAIDEKGCHICTSHACNGDGYPYVHLGGKYWRLSRYTYTEYKGVIPEGMVIRHTCDERKCINPDHLILGTLADNNRDRKVRGRNRNQDGVLNNRSKLCDEQVKEIFYSKESKQKIKDEYNISLTTINCIKARTLWKHITKYL